VSRKQLLPVNRRSAGRLSTSTCARQSWSEPLPCPGRRCAIVRGHSLTIIHYPLSAIERWPGESYGTVYPPSIT
jgi:hypothetical protein